VAGDLSAWSATAILAGCQMINETRTMICLYMKGTGTALGACYGTSPTPPGDCGIPMEDPEYEGIGYHAPPYEYKYMLYDLNDLKAVKDGTGGKTHENVTPYEFGEFTLSFTTRRHRLLGLAYDSTNHRLHTMSVRVWGGADLDYPIGIVIPVSVGDAEAPPEEEGPGGANFSTPAASVAAGSSNGGSSVTTASIDTTSCVSNCLIVVGVTYYGINTAPAITDSESNTYTCLTERKITDGATRICYKQNATVDATHTFTATGAASFPSIAVQAWSGGRTASSADQQNGANATGTSLAAGSVTPSEDNELVVTTVNNYTDTGTSRTINGSYTITNQVGYSLGQHFPIALAWKVQTTAAATNPTWSWTGSQPANAAIATFKAKP
jgi:hypothetical protein